jgi:hypothetical protein
MTQSVSNTKGVLHALSKAIVFLLGASFILSVQAQSNTVECTYRSTYTTHEGRGLYIQAGLKAGPGFVHILQTFMIDLSKSWNTNNPSIEKFPDGPTHYSDPSGISSDGKSWYTLIGDRGSIYNASTNRWSDKFWLDVKGTVNLVGATDPTNDMMYIPFGYPNANRKRSMLRVNLKNGDTESDNRSFSLSQQDHYSTAWNPLRKSLIYISISGVYEYTWEKGWASFFNKGLDSIAQYGACLVSVSGGRKMALFGGLTKDSKDTTADLYILDLTKKSWTKVPVDPKQKSLYSRKDAACGSSGDQVIIWGGSSSSGNFGVENVCPKQRTLVFNVKTMKWSDRYVASK